MAKNKDSKTVNRTGVFDMDKMQITAEDKSGIYVYDVKALLEEFDGEQISFTLSSDFNPSYVVTE